MLTNLIGDMCVKMTGGLLDKYKTVIGGLALILYAVVLVAKHYVPDLPVPQMSFEQILGGGGALMTGVGLLHKSYKAGLYTPVPVVAVPAPVPEAPAEAAVVEEPMAVAGNAS